MGHYRNLTGLIIFICKSKTPREIPTGFSKSEIIIQGLTHYNFNLNSLL